MPRPRRTRPGPVRRQAEQDRTGGAGQTDVRQCVGGERGVADDDEVADQAGGGATMVPPANALVMKGDVRIGRQLS